MSASIGELRQSYKQQRQALFASLDSPHEVNAALHAHALAVDEILTQQWQKHGLDQQRLALLAVGGYGRTELFPFSDVDILILHNVSEIESVPGIDAFLSEAWDLGFEIGHSVRSVTECLESADEDVTVATSLLERRFITGSAELARQMDDNWALSFEVERFVQAKLFEQQQRYARFQDTAYNLEPNIKESPGGLRDVQMVQWLAHALEGATSIDDLLKLKLMDAQELASTRQAYDFMKFLRTRLHLLANRHEDRLVFELQTALATSLGVQPQQGLRASEVLMKRYYQSARQLRLFNDILIDALTSKKGTSGQPVKDSPFAIFEGRLGLQDANTALTALQVLQSFRLLYGDNTYSNFTHELRRAIVRSLTELPADAYDSPECRQECAAFLRSGTGIYHALKSMNDLGVLGKLLPPWQPIVGQMQHDLFHVYTVDQHILMVLRNMRRFTDPTHSHEYPLCSELMQDFPEKELLYLACLFHDIAKGRGGDHSELGMVDARHYCTELGLPPEHVDLVSWLVEQHLTMSTYAQKKDITDPSVVREFAQIVGDQRHLVALYLLTVADVRGTSPKVWNNWKARLLEQLFRSTRSYLSNDGEDSVFDALADRMMDARRKLALYAIDPDQSELFWRDLDSVYLQRHNADEIAWHTRNLYFRPHDGKPVVRTRLMPGGAGLQVMVYVKDAPDLFKRIMGVFARLNFSVLDARIHTTRSNYALDTFTLINPGSVNSAYRDVIQLLEHGLTEALTSDTQAQEPSAAPLGKATRQQRHFPIKPRIEISGDDNSHHYVLEIVAADRTGLLARISEILAKRGISIETARINTLGSRAEDVFVVSGGRLSEESTRIQLETDLAEALA